MSHDFYRMLLGGAGGGGGGGGGCGAVLANPADDNFDCGSSIDTAGVRFSGCTPWTIYRQSTGHAVNSSQTQSGGECFVSSGNYTDDPDPHGATQPFPSGNVRYRAKMRSTTSQSFWSMGGLVLHESATNKNALCFMGYDLSYKAAVWAQTGISHTHNTYSGPTFAADTATYWLEVERSGTTLIFRATDDATDGNDLTTPLGTSAVMSVSQTTDFTTTPDLIGVFSSGNVYIPAFDWFKRLL
jgi:hypothetical protein